MPVDYVPRDTVVETDSVYRRPWFWAVIIAVAAVLVFAVVIAANSPDRVGTDSTTVIQQPSPTDPAPAVTPLPVPAPAAAPAPAPVPPQEPALAKEPQVTTIIKPEVVREKTVIIREPRTPPGTAFFRNTRLPKELRFEDHPWTARDTVTVEDPAAELISAGQTEDGKELFVRTEDREPYDSLFIAVPDQTRLFVEYQIKN